MLAIDFNLLRDVNQSPLVRGPNPTQFVEAGSYTYFVAAPQTSDSGLWRTDGTPEGTIFLKPAYTGIEYPTNVNGILYFQAFDSYSRELWRSDGTPEGTRVVKRIAGDYEASPSGLVNFNGTLYFFANDGVHGRELWRSDGTANGTTLVKDLVPGSSSSYGQLLGRVGGHIFVATPGNLNETVLWRSDGSASGTTPITTLTGVAIGQSQAIGNRLFYSSGYGGLWVNNGIGQSIDLLNGPPYGVGNLRNLGETLYFTRDLGYADGAELWQSDGTLAGTKRVDGGGIYNVSTPTSNDSNNNSIYYVKRIGESGSSQLWRISGVGASPALVEDFQNPGGTLPSSLVSVGDRLFFRHQTLAHGEELWTSDDTTTGTVEVKDVMPGNGSSSMEDKRAIGRIGAKAVFSANDGVHGAELWMTDGTEAGTILLKDLVAGTYESRPRYLTEVSGTLFFLADDGIHGGELWRSDGTPAGTSLVKDIRPGADGSFPQRV